EMFALEYAQPGNTLEALRLHCDISNLELLRDTVEGFLNERPIDLLIANPSQNNIIKDAETRWEDLFEQITVTNITGIIGNFEIVWPFLETLPSYSYNILPPRIINTVTYFIGLIGDFLARTNGVAWI
ncbi:12973_t:CDS:2, partial [Racocetra fulgida]